ncbi:TB2/DP1/HVA22-related protein [Corchorus capsularis]|uniref:HVA22-like protein n=1 Tax=Corchorus capsularis TaxID=210143 RepID=A0A1R3HW32_COCAP|nr:TB2/DP1/HVA22-related protein [Corchorus capsularis]
MCFGYAYPAYECYKAVEKNKPEMEELLFWCQYWILVAILTVCERIGDAFISWLPLYNGAKLALVVYLWHPKWRGTTYVYNSFLRPYVKTHEPEIDRNLIELKGKARKVGGLYWQRAVTYGQTRFVEILQSFASQKSFEPYLDQVYIYIYLSLSILQELNFDICHCQKASITRPEILKQAVPESSSLSEQQSGATNERTCLLTYNKRMVSAQSCVKTGSQLLSVKRVETGVIQPTSSSGNGNSNLSQEQTPNFKEAAGARAKLHGIWRMFKSA